VSISKYNGNTVTHKTKYLFAFKIKFKMERLITSTNITGIRISLSNILWGVSTPTFNWANVQLFGSKKWEERRRKRLHEEEMMICVSHPSLLL
jgi:hypothetical protein